MAHGAHVHARFDGRHKEPPLHCDSCDDVGLIDTLRDHGAGMEALSGNGTQRGGCWNMAPGPTSWPLAALGLMDRAILTCCHRISFNRSLTVTAL